MREAIHQAVARVLSSEKYTELNLPAQVEATPARLVRGGLASLWWTPEGDEKIGVRDRFEIVNKKRAGPIRPSSSWRRVVRTGSKENEGFIYFSGV